MLLNQNYLHYKKFVLICAFLISNFPNGHGNEGEYFSAVSGLEKLLQTEIHILAELQNYVDAVSMHIDALKSEIEVIQAEHLLAAQDVENYLNNPINSYRLIKRLQSDWSRFEESINNDESAKNFLETMLTNRKALSFPAQNDVYSAASGLVRLQDTYKLDVTQLASGLLNGVKYGTEMSWQDCFLLGHHLYEMRDFNHTVPWLKESMKLLTAQEYNQDTLSLDFITVVATYHQEMGDFENALELVNYVLDADPTREHLQLTKQYLQEMLSNGIKTGLLHEAQIPRYDYHQTNEYKLYERICRSEIGTMPKQQRRLRCTYYTNEVPYRILQPFKMEELFSDPYIVRFHDVVRENEIDVIKSIATPKMTRSMVQPLNGTNEVVANYRTSKSAWFDYDSHVLMQNMRQHVEDLSGLSVLQAAEYLQVANYGIGGHYEPHWDFFPHNSSYDNEEDGNRIATAIYYLSDVEEGGGTAFPYLPLLVKPERGSVLFWYNLHKSEQPDYRTRHGACPVLKGSKWIANIWIRVREQFHTRPCEVQPDHEISSQYENFD